MIVNFFMLCRPRRESDIYSRVEPHTTAAEESTHSDSETESLFEEDIDGRLSLL